MRFHPARGLATAGAIAAILAATACSSNSSSSSTPPAATSSAAATPSAGSASGAGSVSASAGSTGSASGAAGTSSGAGAQIKANWEKFFASSTPTSERVALLQNGSTFASVISSLSSNPLASGLSATVTSVTVTSSTMATVKYNLASAGATVQTGTTGTAVLEGGVWKVGDASFCGLLNEAGTLLNIKPPAACKSA
jgi:hypothetical protein